MKPLFILLFSSLAFIPSVIALSPFPETDAIWSVKVGYNQIYIYGLTGDTLIDGKQYHKLYQLNDTTLSIDENAQYIGALRNEGKQVWMRPEYLIDSGDSKDCLLYDFGLDVGDVKKNDFAVYMLSRPPRFHFYNDEHDLKIFIENVTEDSQGRKHYIVVGSEIFGDEWIEGIGSLSGLFWYSVVGPVGGGLFYKPELICMKQNNAVIYQNMSLCDGDCFGCYYGVGIDETRTDEQVATLYPNPVKEYLTIDLAESVASIQFILYDTQGQEQYTRQLTEPHTRLTLPARLKGLYHYRLTGGDDYRQSGTLLIE